MALSAATPAAWSASTHEPSNAARTTVVNRARWRDAFDAGGEGESPRAFFEGVCGVPESSRSGVPESSRSDSEDGRAFVSVPSPVPSPVMMSHTRDMSHAGASHAGSLDCAGNASESAAKNSRRFVASSSGPPVDPSDASKTRRTRETAPRRVFVPRAFEVRRSALGTPRGRRERTRGSLPRPSPRGSRRRHDRSRAWRRRLARARRRRRRRARGADTSA